MKELVIISLVIIILILIILIIIYRKDKYVYDPLYASEPPPNLSNKPELKSFFEKSDINVEQNVNNARHIRSCERCQANQTSFFKPSTVRHCEICASAVNGQKIKDRFMGIL